MEKAISPIHAVDLPDDLIVEILARLPARSLCRFKCVSRSWHALISDPTHRARLPQTLTGFFVIISSSPHSPIRAHSLWSFINLMPPRLEGGEGSSIMPPLVDIYKEVELLDSSNGLLLLRCSCSDEEPPSKCPFYVICNPATREWPALPQPGHALGRDGDPQGENTEIICAALGFDPAFSPCFYVFLLVDEKDRPFTVLVETYSSETGAWKSRREELICSETGSWRTKWDEPVCAPGLKTYANGFLYVAKDFNEEIAVVDTQGRITWYDTYFRDFKYDYGIVFMGHSQGRLLYVVDNQTGDDSLSIYVHQDHGGKGWVLKHKISKPDLFGTRKSPLEVGHQTLGFHPHGNSIFFYDRTRDRVICYDMTSRGVRDICSIGETEGSNNHLFLPYIPFYSKLLASPNALTGI